MRKQDAIFLNSVFFVLGFTLVFSLVGVIFQTVLLHASFFTKNILPEEIGGVMIIVFGVLLVASARYVIPFFSMEHRFKFKKFNNGFVSASLFGVAFALGWTPCVGPILGAIYTFAAISPGTGFLLLMAFSLGLGIPFLVFGAFISKASVFIHKAGKFIKYFNVVGGALLIVIGLFVITGYIGLISVFLVGNGGAMSLNAQLDFFFALLAGLLTFLSPCILPLVPAYISYMAGTTAEEVKR